TLYRLITGQPPFHTGECIDLAVRIVSSDFSPMSTRRIDVAPGLEEVVQRCLERRREDRFSSVMDLAQALAPFTSHGRAASVIPPPARSSEGEVTRRLGRTCSDGRARSPLEPRPGGAARWG